MFQIFLCFNGYLQNHSHVSKQRQQTEISYCWQVFKEFCALVRKICPQRHQDSRNSIKIFKNLLNFPSICCLMLFCTMSRRTPWHSYSTEILWLLLLVFQNLLVTTLYFLYFTLQREKTTFFFPQTLQTRTKL